MAGTLERDKGVLVLIDVITDEHVVALSARILQSTASRTRTPARDEIASRSESCVVGDTVTLRSKSARLSQQQTASHTQSVVHVKGLEIQGEHESSGTASEFRLSDCDGIVPGVQAFKP